MYEIEQDKVESKKLDIECRLENWEIVRDFIITFYKRLQINVISNNIILACEEIFVNISQYAYTNKKSLVSITCSYIFHKKEIYIEFVDSGIEFNPTNQTISKIKTPLDKRELGGFGILIAKTVLDCMEYNRVNNKNILKIRKKIKER